jgi:Domain of unknown function (DUF3597)
VDIEAVLTAMQAKTSEQLNWRTSIVDLLKLLGLDSSLSARKGLASELHYDGDTNDSASMNVWACLIPWDGQPRLAVNNAL